MQPEFNRALKLAFNPNSQKLNSMGIVIGIIGPLTRGLSLELVLVNPWPLSGGVGISSACFGDRINSMTSTFFSTVSVT